MFKPSVISAVLIISLAIPHHILADTTAPNPPVGLTAQPQDNLISLSWSPNSEEDLAEYNVYRSVFSGNYYTKMNFSLITDTSYQDSEIVAGSEYFYVVTALDTSGNESAYSEEIRVFANRDIKLQTTKTKSWTSQSDWQEGTAFQVDTSFNPGDVQLERGEFIADEHTVALWHFNEGSGTTAYDETTNSNDGTLTNMDPDASWVEGKFGTALSFDGVDDYVITPNMRNYFSNESVTIEVWFKAYGPGVIIDELGQSSINTGWHDSQIEILSSGEVKVRVWNLGSVSLGTVNFGEWHYAVLRYDRATKTLDGFLDGVEAEADVSGDRSSPWESSKGLYYAFGAKDSTNLGSGAYFNGLIDEIRISNIARTDFTTSRPFLTSGTLTLDFDSQQLSNFTKLDLTTDIPEGTSIAARVKSAYTQAELETTTWSDYYDTFPINLSDQNNQRYIRIELLLETSDPEPSPVISDLSLTYELAENKQFKTFTSQSDWQEGTAFQVDTSFNPGDVQLERGEFLVDEHTVALWHFNEGGGSTLTDSSANDNDGTINGATWTDGKFGKALSFDGVNDYVNIPSVNPTTAVTVEAWVKSATATGYSGVRQIVSKYSAYILGTASIGGKDMGFLIHNGTDWYDYSNKYTVSTPDEWHYFVGTYDSSTNEQKLYVDGILQSKKTVSGVINSDTGPIHLGHREGVAVGSDHFNGLIDEVRISDIARTDLNESRDFLSSGTLTLDFDSRQLSNFTNLNLTSDTPEGTAIKARVKSAYTENELDDATWSDYYDAFPADLSGQDNKRWIRIELLLETTDPEVTPVVSDLTIEYELSKSPLSLKTWTSQSDWEEGIGSQIDTMNNPGDVELERGEFLVDEHTVALWHFNEGTGTTVYDETTNSNDGALTNMDTDTVWVEGRFGSALSFDGVNDYVKVADSDSLTVTDCSVEAWIKTDDKSDYKHIISNYHTDSNAKWYHLYIENTTGKARFQVDDGTSSPPVVVGTSDVADGEWHHLMGVRDTTSGLLRIYVDGIEENIISDTTSGNLNPKKDLWIGGQYSYSTRYFTGLIDEVRISDIARTDLNESREVFSPGALTLDFDTGQRSNFVKLDWTEENTIQTNVNPVRNNPPEQDAPPSAGISNGVKVRIKTADTKQELDTVLWSEYFDTSAVELINIIDQRWVRIEAYLETQDITQSPLLKNLTIWYTPFESYLDVNRDGKVDEKDSELITQGLGLTEGDPDFNPYLDVNDDGIINEEDQTEVANNYDTTLPQTPVACYVKEEQGNSRNEINFSNYTNVTLAVELPESSLSTDLVTVTLSDGVNEIKATSYALEGGGTLTISGIDTGIFKDKMITLAAFIENEAGRSAYLVGEDAYKSVNLAEIFSPVEGQVLAEGTSLEIIGTALSPNLDSYVLEYGQGENPSSWTEIASSNTPIDRDILATWNVPSEKKTYYTIRLRVMEDNTTVASATVGINILMLYNLSDSPDPFSPNADSIKDTNTITATVTMPIDWTITIKDASDATVKTYTGTGSSISQTWDGTDQEGTTVVNDGLYTYDIDGQELESGVFANQQTGTITLDATYPEAIITSPLDEEVIFLEIDITGTASDEHFKNYKLEYADAESPTVWTTIKTSTSQVVEGKLATWKTEDLVNDYYTLRLTVEDNAGNISTTSVNVTVDNLQLTDISTTNQFFNPAESQTSTISYSLDRDANVTIKIYQAIPLHESSPPNRIYAMQVGNIVRTLVNNQLRTEGVNYEIWDGRDDAGQFLPEATYIYTLYAEAESGSSAQYNPQYVLGAVTIESVSITESFNPYANEYAQITYTISEPAWVTIKIGDSRVDDAGEERTLLYGEPRDKGTHTELWDGRANDGHILEPDEYDSLVGDAIILPENALVIQQEESFAITDFKAEAYLIYPNYDQVSTLSYTLTKDSGVTIKIYDPNGSYFRTITEDESQVAGIYTYEWDGKNDEGLLVDTEGIYSVKIQAEETSSGITAVWAGNVVVYR